MTNRTWKTWVAAIAGAVGLLGMALALAGCSAGSTRLARGPHGPDAEVVQSFVCRGEAAQADHYLETLGVPIGDRIAIVERARLKACPGGGSK